MRRHFLQMKRHDHLTVHNQQARMFRIGIPEESTALQLAWLVELQDQTAAGCLWHDAMISRNFRAFPALNCGLAMLFVTFFFPAASAFFISPKLHDQRKHHVHEKC